MKTTTIRNAKVEKAIDEQEGTRLTLDENAFGFIQDVLTKLYSNPWKAILREYTSNALDAHIAANSFDRPVEVTLPPYGSSGDLVIRDYGVGMSVDELRRIYSKFGASTKRATNKQVGGFGFGCKSALAEVQEFFITSTKDGVTVEAAVRKDASGSALYITSETPESSEPNGTTVRIPTFGKTEFFLDLIRENFFIGYSREELVVRDANGNEIPRASVHTPAYTVGEIVPGEPVVWVEKRVSDTNGYYNPSLLLGGVVYPLDSHQLDYGTQKLVDKLSLSRRVFVNVPVGSVNLIPSREALQYTKETKATLSAVLSNAEAVMEHVIASEYNTIQDTQKVLALFNKDLSHDYRQIFDQNKVTWKGHALPENLAWASEKVHLMGRSTVAGKTKNYVTSFEKLPLKLSDFLAASTIITGVKAKDLPSVNRGFHDYLKSIHNDDSVRDLTGSVLVVDTLPKSVWLEGKSTTTLGEYMEIVKKQRRLTRERNAASREANPRQATAYWAFIQGGKTVNPYRITAEEAEGLNVPIYYVARKLYPAADKLLTNVTVNARIGYSSLPGVLSRVSDNGIVIFIEATRSLDKFLKDMPNAVDIMADLKERATKLAEELASSDSSMTAQVQAYANSDWSHRNTIRNWEKLAGLVTEAGLLGQVEDATLVDFFTALIGGSAVDDEAAQKQHLFKQVSAFADPERIAQLQSIKASGEPVAKLADKYWIITNTVMNSPRISDSLPAVVAYMNGEHAHA